MREGLRFWAAVCFVLASGTLTLAYALGILLNEDALFALVNILDE